MQYFYIKPEGGKVAAVIRANFTSTSLLHDIVNYSVLRGMLAYGADESHWDNAVAFDLYPCIEFDGKEFITIHEPDQGS